ncbi:MAG TPA: VWA domain-containing protein [Acidobacteriaceae bacterium]|nr:VWA domain-containing protein [Acidobacteriaceae bacterium]
MSSVLRFVVLLAGAGVASLGWAQGAPVASASGSASTSGSASGSTTGSTPGAGTASTAGQGGATVLTLKAAAQLVVVDVVATDRNHQPVHGLTAADFSLTENGAAQTVKHFEEHSAASVADATKFAPMPKLPPNMFTNYTPAPAGGSVTLLLLDEVNTPLADQAYVRQQLLTYLKTRPPGMRIAIFGLNAHLVLLQGFTSNPDVLRAAVEQGKGKASFILQDKVGGAGIQDSQADVYEDQDADKLGDAAVPPAVIAAMREFDAMNETLQIQVRTKYTLDAMNEIARYVSGIAGRKNLIWFSGSFPLDILPDETGQLYNAFSAMGSSEDEYRETIAKLSRSQVAVYPVDARGVGMSSVSDASSTRNYMGPSGSSKNVDRNMAMGQARLNADNAKFLDRNAAEHSTMDVLAADTGGEAFFNTNNLTEAVAKAVEDGSNFYTLSYTPTDQRQDGKERKIKIQVTRPGVSLAYRVGYYADAPEKKGAKTDAAAVSAGQDSLRVAMMRGAPTPTEILIKVAVARMTAGGKTEDKVATGNFPAAATKGPFERYGVDFAINPGDLVFLRGEDGKVHIDYDALVYVYDANGDLLNWVGRTHPIAGTAEQVRLFTEHGIQARAEVSVPAKGEYFLRIAVHDRNRDRYGAVEVDTSQVKDVVPAGDGVVAK